jgi:histidyl-tRNA synthetase
LHWQVVVGKRSLIAVALRPYAVWRTPPTVKITAQRGDFMAKVGKISGFPEWLPEQKLAEDKVISKIKKLYESFGFTPIETPAVELLTTLSSKGVIDKEIFAVKRLKAAGDEEAEMGLHFDLTVPFARYVAQHAQALSFPFKRYQLQKVWRGDRPQKGRFREFYQFDIDIIARNELPLSCDAEILSLVGLVMNEVNLGRYMIRLNHRKLLSGLYAEIGLDEAQRKAAIIAVDKIFKIGVDGVAAELSKIIESTTVQCPIAELEQRIAGLGLSSEAISEGVRDLQTICALVPEAVLANISIDLTVARGLDYYTGIVLEVGMTEYPEFGTVFAGGRYENLASDFTDQALPGVGVSVGLSRLMELAFDKQLISVEQKTTTQALVTVYSEGDRVVCNQVAHALRAAGVATEVFYKSPKLGKQIDYADAKGIRYVFFVEENGDKVQVKDLVTKEQVVVTSLAAWAATTFSA